ncbi:DUF6415 family natural product biosynthesis protein [Streptomyces sp. NPDC085927]|uniref:DUF6415 family natural product biosynthesis protein n=1 Tax=Streptomyces sp. NPDC085927 TaxID=3365738 RepID=UPI0037D8F299
MIFDAFDGLAGRAGISPDEDSRFAQRSCSITHFALRPPVEHAATRTTWLLPSRSSVMPSSPAPRLPRASFGVARPRLASSAGGTARHLTTAARETVALVLDDNSPLPETPEDVECLVARLRGHISQLGVVVPADDLALIRAQRLSSADPPDGYLPSRVHLVQLAKATLGLVSAAQRIDRAGLPATPPSGRRSRRLSRNTWRVLVLTVALITVVLAASLPRT